MLDNYLPLVGKILQSSYTDRRRAYLDGAAEHYPALRWPKRRSSKRKPYPGVLDAADHSEG